METACAGAGNTDKGLAAAESGGKRLGRPAALGESEVAELVKAYRDEGVAVKALAREYGIAPKTVRRVLDTAGAREVPDDLSELLDGDDQDADGGRDQEADADAVVVVDVPGLVAESLVDVADGAVRQALDAGQTIRRGQGYSVRVTAPLSLHLAMVEQPSTGLMGSPAGRKAHRIHSDRAAAARTPTA
ncbi:helix-turn-helix domain-containing protein [Streptomyces sp. NPDC048278]|uniref:helix-turn-helix domain-containing protein n=1 Tax=unclassified Streptomyces TaxID=2593676 RepID=UPI0034185DAE